MIDCSISTSETAWCPGCGDVNILDSIKGNSYRAWKDSLMRY